MMGFVSTSVPCWKGVIVVTKFVYKSGRNSRIGGVCYAGDKLAFFAGYSNCESCGVRSKVLMTPDDIREFGNKMGFVGVRTPLGLRFARALEKRYGL